MPHRVCHGREYHLCLYGSLKLQALSDSFAAVSLACLLLNVLSEDGKRCNLEESS